VPIEELGDVRMGLLPNATFLVAAVVTIILYSVVLEGLYSISEVKAISTVQLAAAFGYGAVLAVWIGAEAAFLVARLQPRYGALSMEDDSEHEDGEKSSLSPMKERVVAEPSVFHIKPSHLPTLRLCGEFVAILGYIYFCDRTTQVAKGPKYQNPTAFWCVNLAILGAALLTLRSVAGGKGEALDGYVKPLQRDQTEEWKGWMQIMFVLYHYFNETEIYNAIRMYIAAYVWMTGFGNFSYYYVKKDFTAVRFTQMMWRLNFFVFFVCITMNNEYMLYYICPMHTFFTWGVFIPLFICNSYNDSFKVLFVKIVCTFLGAFLLYDVPNIFQTVMQPLHGLLEFHDPLHPENSPMHEWFFRSGLDHLVWVFGMFCAFAFPWFDRKLQALEELPTLTRHPVRSVVTAATLGLTIYWYVAYFSLPKRAYNKVHPYTSFIAIFTYLVLRNIVSGLRERHMHLFAWCGKITLETYILQFHVWMKTTGVNGSPKFLMVWFPGYFWINFVVVTAAYIFLSYRVFIITAALRDVVIPKEGGAALGKRAVFVAVILAAFYGVAYLAAPHLLGAPPSPP